jgi:cell shape-determining protein MreD
VKRGLAMLAVGLVALGIQGGLATFLPRELCPDLGLLVVLALGLQIQSWTIGFALATVLGYSADLLSGSLFGAHALLRLLTFCSAALVRSQLNLRGTVPLGLFAAVVTMLYAVGLFALTGFFGSASEVRWGSLSLLIPQALVNAFAIPFVFKIVAWLWDRLEGEPVRRGLELDARRPAI